MRRFFKIVSGVLHPLLLPLFGTLCMFQAGIFKAYPLNYELFIAGIVFLNMGFIPGFGVWLLKKNGHVSDYDVSVRTERVFPYLITELSYITAIILLWRYQMPWWVIKLFMGSIVATLFAFFITLRWKISAHTLAFGVLIGGAFLFSLRQSIFPIPFFVVALLLAGLQASSRLYLKAHTLGQVTGGFFLGLASVHATYFLIP
ncbi:MAG: phosphatase PAP2 family protein [Bacteroidales bacterium]|jgi:membrane-associated phospholipid phosphatase|nr:phosphatase PAP2 family protein [Bacteroidales bacterium]MDD3167495.1 phosphatase PAP2 family protein [Bacteroidales bacterium]MDD4771474.1 phosphatase PAP2 family protein [Bacteroidales bacterium]